MNTSAATQQPLRIVSRRAQNILQRHRQQQQGGGGQSSQTAKKSPPKKEDETSWPKSIRYTFYTACAAAVPLSIGQAIALSPKLRDQILGDAIEDEDTSSSSTSITSPQGIISLVRNYWGNEDYTAPVDRPQMKYVTPGSRKIWQEDNYTSFLQLFGLYTPPYKNEQTTIEEEDASVPLSLDNEPPFNIRHDQTILSKYLSTASNPSGVNARLTLLPCNTNTSDGNIIDIEDTAGYITECTLPANTNMNTIREHIKGSDAQYVRRGLMESDPNFEAKSTGERLRTKSWREECSWTIDFADDDNDKKQDITYENFDDAEVAHISVLGGSGLGEGGTSASSSKELRHFTAIHSSWTFFPESDMPVTSPTAMGSVASGSSNTSTTTASTNISTDSLQEQRLKHQITTLEKDLKDPSSMRDRDDMYEELRLAKRELKSLKPWYKRLW